MKRRDFVSMLLGSTAAIVIPQRVISLPPRRPYMINSYFTSKYAWFLKTEHEDGIALYTRAHPQSFYAMTDNGLVELNESALEQIEIELPPLPEIPGFLIQPVKGRGQWRS